MSPVIAGRSGFPILAVSAAVVVGCATVPARSQPPAPAGQASSRTEKASPEPDLADLRAQVVEAHNRIRGAAGLPTLSVSDKLQAAAQAHAQDMAARQKMTHVGKRGSSPFDRIKSQGYPYRRAGENIAAGSFGVDRLMKGWMDSPPHKRNILGGFSQIGVGCAIGEDGKRYWCVTFGLPVRR
jgi:uncharacterized protein YkwD